MQNKSLRRTPMGMRMKYGNRSLGLLALSTLATTAARADTYVEPNPLRAIQHAQQGSADVTIRTVSARNDMVSGGDVLVRIDPKQGLDAATLKIARNGTDVSTAFKKNGAGLLGLVTGLSAGDNTIEVTGAGNLKASLVVTNYSVTGPIFSGPKESPFFCETNVWSDMPGKLGAPKDKDCAIDTRV